MTYRHHYLWILSTAALALAGCSADSGADSRAGQAEQPAEEQAAVVRTLAIEATEVTDTAVLSADLNRDV